MLISECWNFNILMSRPKGEKGMSRQLDLQIYLALHGYPLKEIPKERFDDYMREPHYSTDAEAMLELDREMRERGYSVTIKRDIKKYVVMFQNKNINDDVRGAGCSEILTKAYSLAAHKALTGKEWEKEEE